MKLRSVTSQAVTGKNVLVRVDYNVPLANKNGKTVVADDRRIRISLDTIQFLLKHNCRVFLVAHLGRPKGEPQPKYTLAPIAEHLKQYYHLPVTFVTDWVDKLDNLVSQSQPGSVTLLENMRFYPGEKKNDETLARTLAEPFDCYVNDAFSAAHRAHVSTVGVTQYLPAYAGFSLANEVEALTGLMSKPKRPFVIVLGGAKISDKVNAAKKLSEIADLVLIGGAVANNFLKADGLEIHKSFIEDAPADLAKAGVDYVSFARKLMDAYQTERVLKDGYIPIPKILHPIDVLAARSLETRSSKQVSVIDLSHDMADTPDDKELRYLDIGPKTVRLYSELLKTAHTVFWNGPMGVWENPLFARGTRLVARSIAHTNGTSVIGGGDTIAAVDHFGLEKKFTYVSAAGGAALDFLGGAELPGLKPLHIEHL